MHAKYDTLWDRIRASMYQAGLNQAQLAARIGVSRATITCIKNGKSRAGIVLGRLAQVLGVPMQWLRDGTGPAPSWVDSDSASLPPLAVPLPIGLAVVVSGRNVLIDQAGRQLLAITAAEARRLAIALLVGADQTGGT